MRGFPCNSTVMPVKSLRRNYDIVLSVTVPKVRAAISGPKPPGKRLGDKKKKKILKKSMLSAVKTPR